MNMRISKGVPPSSESLTDWHLRGILSGVKVAGSDFTKSLSATPPIEGIS